VLALLKLTVLIAFAHRRAEDHPWFLGYVARTGARDLFTLAVLVLALGIAVDSAQFFGASMALGAFLAGEAAVYGDASEREILHHAGIEKADGLIIAASGVPADAVVKAARELNPKIRILTRATYLRETGKLREAGANAVFSSEGEIALSMTEFVMRRADRPGAGPCSYGAFSVPT
jgi:voltage-gated potassium channel Kch